MPIKSVIFIGLILKPIPLTRVCAFYSKRFNILRSKMSTIVNADPKMADTRSINNPKTKSPTGPNGGPKGGDKPPIYSIPLKDRLFSAEQGILLKDVVCFSLYHFAPITNPNLSAKMFENQLKQEALIKFAGTCYLANEGFNAQFSVVSEYLAQFQDQVKAATDIVFGAEVNLDFNIGETLTTGTQAPFKRFRVVARPQILTDGLREEFNWSDPGPELDAKDWHEQLTSSNKPLLLDCRNAYETDIGAFDGAIPLGTQTFAESWSVLDKMVEDKPKDEPIYAYCTGGIRCVKVGAYLKQKHGLTNVRRLRHGTIGYERWAKRPRESDDENCDDSKDNHGPKSKSIFLGTNFIFDERPREVTLMNQDATGQQESNTSALN